MTDEELYFIHEYMTVYFNHKLAKIIIRALTMIAVTVIWKLL